MVDDIELGITHVIRGEDHVTNTGAQIQMVTALAGPVPVFAHLPPLVDVAGKGLSKRAAGGHRSGEGAEMAKLLPLIGRVRAEARLRGERP